MNTNEATQTNHYETYFSYRFIKAFYYAALVFLSAFVLIIGWFLNEDINWIGTIIFWLTGCAIVYIALNLAKETTLYVILGKKLSWTWLRVIDTKKISALLRKNFGLYFDVNAAAALPVKSFTEDQQPFAEWKPGSSSAQGFDTSLDIIWSKNPCCYEKHLQRRLNNPLFPHDRRSFTLKEFEYARKKDAEDLYNLKMQAKNLTEILAAGNDREPISKRLHQIDNLIDFSYEVGGEAKEITEYLNKLRCALILDWKNAVQSSNEATASLENAESYHNNNVKPFRNEFIAQLKRDGSPISQDFVPALLSEDINTIKLFIFLLNNEASIAELKNGFISIVASISNKNLLPPDTMNKLKTIGIDINL